MFTWITNTWNKFETWVASWMPGFKTYTVTALGAVGSAAGILQEYITGLPLDRFMTASQITIATAVLFTLAFWFRRLADKT